MEFVGDPYYVSDLFIRFYMCYSYCYRVAYNFNTAFYFIENFDKF